MKYDGATQGMDTVMTAHDIDDLGLPLMKGQRCMIVQDSNRVILDRALVDSIRRFMDEQGSEC